ncbi:MAG: DUF5032 domain-containing protein [Tannerellaceae bacterium]|jgi:hypothetical protein|nr:DUF5032 domain-containing protein [Tannerellaceae bacterium]
MKKYVSLLIALSIGLTSCGKDDDGKKPALPTLNRLTKVTCTKNNASYPQHVLTITYNQNGLVSDIVRDGKYTDIFTFDTDRMIVNSFTAEGTSSPVLTKKVNYQLSQGGIIKSEIYLKNQHKNNEEYLSDVYSFLYNRSNLITSSWDETHWPKTDGTGYENRAVMETFTYTWEDGNLINYKSGTKEMTFTYKNEFHPETFPLRFVNTFDFTVESIVTPLNFFLGNRNRKLVETAYWYILPDVENIHAKYSFSYNSTGEYITGMTVTEEIFPINGATAQNNTYVYSLEYNYK